ncbi:MAG: hypothetical protein WD851_00870 [Pirellulales bacterium]
MKRSAMRTAASALLIVGMTACLASAQTPVTWDGGNFNWETAHWNGGQTAAAVFGDNRMSNGTFAVTIGDGSNVLYNSEVLGDFRPRSNVGPTSITVNEGATLEVNTPQDGDTDGNWTQFDADLTLDNGSFKRTLTTGGGAQAGGLLMFGSWRSVPDQHTDITLLNGGRFENNGQVWFGADQEHAPGLTVSMVINDGSVDLTGGAFPQSNDDNIVQADLAFFYGHDFALGECNGCTANGDPKNEEYEVNFRGPGSMTVDASGIWVYDQADAAGAFIWSGAQYSYQQLWDRGILKSKGMTGGYLDPATDTIISTGQAFGNFFTVTNGSVGSADYTLTRKDPTVVTWDGGTGEWNDDAKWNGGQLANTPGVLNSNRGSSGGHAIVIDGSVAGGANVSYDGNAGTGTNQDFRLEPNNGVSSMTIKNGGVFSLQSADDIDGVFTRWGGDLTVDGAGSKFVRTKTLPSHSGGAWMLGAFSQKFGQEIDVVVSDGGRIENEGELYFGGDGGENAAGLSATITIDGGSMDLRGGDAIEGGFGFGNGSNDLEAAMNLDLGFFTTVPNISPSVLFMYTLRPAADGEGPAGLANEEYVINFTGSGSITVDHAGIYAVTQDENSGLFTAAAKPYEQLWADGVLQANGESGLTGAIFGDFFNVTGAHLSDGYTLTSLIGAGLAGDYNGDGTVNAADYTVWRDGGSPDDTQAGYDLWEANFGNSGSGSGSGAVPEPSSVALALTVLLAGLAVRRSRG